ncbi:hypothetical protein N6H18_12210 [Reichenbachiella agarivorans]|uniref:Outer membrane protein beta-barrel domain-containing protein n=1 Tax=Reichenbachiella agarivorans TaxID=2979464 RepID=A0ABY6CL41_9BACT|nr:hypothetical protein [Reichenbachiella agarivorans]UXP31114.1 hypothetical protein N6H18_12210 [Reichenbachiella agarivorans]
MKKTTIILLMGLVCLYQSVHATNDSTRIIEDTVVIEFGKRSKMVIITDSPEDLKKLEQFDINQMIMDLNVNLDSTSNFHTQIIIEDETGTKFLKDSVDSEDGGLVYYGDETSSDSEWKESDWDDSDNGDFDFWPSSDDEEKRTRGAFEIEFGMNNWLQKGKFPDATGELYTIKPWGSWYFGLGHTNRTHITGPLMLNWGMGVSWYTWKLDNTSVRIIKNDTETVFVEDNTVSGLKSKLSATFINATLVPMLDFGYTDNKNKFGSFKKYSQKGFRVGAGGYIGYRIDSWTKFVYKDNGDKQKDKTKGNYYLNNFRYGVRAQMGFRGTDLFVNYDLNHVFAEDKGPELNGLSFGIIL